MNQMGEKLGSEEHIDFPHVYKQKDSIAYIRGLNDIAANQRLVQIGDTFGWVLSLEEKIVKALMLGYAKNGETVQTGAADLTISTNLGGKVVDFQGNALDGSEVGEGKTLSLISGLKSAPFRRKLVEKQLLAGHMRIDLNDPMAEGNTILFQGPSRSGKFDVALNTAEKYLEGDSDTHVVVVTYNKRRAEQYQKGLGSSEASRSTVFTLGMSSTDTDMFLTPKAGLTYAQNLRNEGKPVLFVLDSLVDYFTTETKIFAELNQPFAPYNISNETMENSGNFHSAGTMTSIMLYDTNVLNFNYEHYQKYQLSHLRSITDQIISFEPEELELKKTLPKLEIHSYLEANSRGWMHPLVFELSSQFTRLADKLRSSFRQHKLKKQFKIQEDPWENYLIHDSKQFLPVLNNRAPLGLTDQILLFKFIEHSVRNASISEYLEKPNLMAQNFLEFAADFEEFDDETSIVEQLEEMLGDHNIEASVAVQKLDEMVERVCRMFYLQQKIQGKVGALKRDYFV